MLFGINVWNFSFNVLFCRLSDCSQRVTVVQIQLFVDSVHLLLCSAVYFFFFPSWAASVYFKCCSTYPSHKGCCRRRINRFIFIKQTLAPWLGTTQGLLDQLSCIFFFCSLSSIIRKGIVQYSLPISIWSVVSESYCWLLTSAQE